MKRFLVLLVASYLATQLAVADPVKVKKLRIASVTKFDAPHGEAIGSIARDQYVPGSWTLAGAPQAGWVQIRGDGQSFWVRNTAIDTDRRITSSADCGAKVIGISDKVAATRALGEDCPSK